MERIPLIEPVVGDKELSNIREVLESGWMTEGPFADELQSLVAEMVGVDHAITVTSCTTGLELALDAAGIGDGDEVIVPDFTYPATASVVVRLGAEPILVDVDPVTYNIDPAAVRSAVTSATEAMVPVSLFGHALDPGPLNEIADEHNLHVIEDAAWTLGCRFEREPVGSQFDASVFSLHPRKVLTTGEGGIVTTDDDALNDEMRTIKNFGLSHYDDSEGFVRANATNYRMSDILAAIGVAQMGRSDEMFERRREIAARYDDLLTPIEGIRPPSIVGDAYHTFGSYCAYVEAGDESARDALIEALDQRDVEAQIGTYALHLTDAFANFRRGSDLAVSAELYHRLLTLPITHSMTEEHQDHVVSVLEEKMADLR